MRKSLLAAVSVLAMSLPAHAQISVFDGTQAASMVRDLQQGAQQLQQLTQQLQQLQQIYYSATHVTDLGSAFGLLSRLGIQNPLPVNPYAVQNLLSGKGGTNGMLSSLQGLYTGTLNGSRVYQVPGNGWLANAVNQSGGGLAGARAVALQLYQSAGERVTGLNQLQARINSAEDPAERESLMNRIAVEQAYIQNQHVQAQALGNYMAAEMSSQQQQEREAVVSSMDKLAETYRQKGLIQ